MHCLKALGEGIVSRDLKRLVAELHIRVAALNRFAARQPAGRQDGPIGSKLL